MTTGLWDFNFFLSSTFVYEQILIRFFINTNNITQTFCKIKYNLKGH